MRITITSEAGDHFINLDVDPSMEVENVKALLEAESNVPTADQLLFFSGRQLLGDKDSLASYDIKEDDMLLLRRKSNEPAAAPSVAGRNVETDAETMRQQLIGNPQLLSQLQRTQPEFADAALNNPDRFRDMLSRFSAMQQSAQLTQQHEADLLSSDPYNVEAQRKIEEAIRQEAVLENMETAWENMPEAFGQVHMLYVNVEVNGHSVKAFVDSGAQATIMSPDCAERCGIMRLLDTRFAGMARGVGTAKILGRVHSAQLKMGQDLFLQCSFTILEGKDVDLLFGLDMLKRHQACIDLQKDALVIQGREIRFLSEHELPNGFENGPMGDEPAGTSQSLSTPAVGSGLGSASAPTASTSSFPGSGQALGAPPNRAAPLTGPSSSSSSSFVPSSGPTSTSTSTTTPQPPSKHFEDKISNLVALGVSRPEAIKLLDLTNGHVEQAAGLLFSGDF
ncbi:BZ3500_MvSof-1268-A1-R1_Chr5-2g08117 [Microbotryum saponariae]|uniref:DNA damage-inducible protein 1 n=1 Tax=Microbotryum saponariae TaxID=289078 RepID=A0A2X0NJK1_9BASI|nr:BZ3500_MvSof-1268-A1-R1_Chr5-2g08117 [Microbotryum saponariae]SDA05986.1 BZ3501_MvSof-1269-A2-R1_Chr5-2g07939 [Microbotryum saponariae]